MRRLHRYRSAKSDGGDTTLVRPSDWNAEFNCYPDAEGSLYDPFETADTDPIAGYSTLGSPNTLDTDTTAKSHCYCAESGSGSVNVVGLYNSWSPSAGQYVETWMSDVVFSATLSSYAGLFIGESGGAGKLTLFGIGRYAAAWDDRIIVFGYNSRTSFATEFTNLAGPWRPPMGLRLKYNSSTSVDAQISHGRGWRQLLNFNPGYTIGIAGVGGDMSASGFTTEAWFDFLNSG